jgi:hypothetical protein
MALSGRISNFLGSTANRTGVDLSLVTSLLSIVVALAFFAGIAYAAVAIPAQTQLQEDLPEDVRGRVFGVLNMLVSVASFLPILVVGPIADVLGPTIVLVLVAVLIGASGIASIYLRGPLRAVERDSRANVSADHDPFVNALGVELRAEDYPDQDGDGIPDWPDDAMPASELEAAGGTVVRAAEPGPATELRPAADPVTAAELAGDPDAVTRVIDVGDDEAVADPGAAPEPDAAADDRGPTA